MKVTVDSRELKRALATAQSVVCKRATTPILHDVLIESVGKDALRVTCTNASQWVSVKIPATVDEEGAVSLNIHCCVPALPSKWNVTLRLKPQLFAPKGVPTPQVLAIEQGDAITTLKITDADRFPRPPEFVPEVEFMTSQYDLQKAIRRMLFAVPPKADASALTGALFTNDGEDSDLRLVGTDRYQLAMVHCPADIIKPFSAIVPNKALALFGKVFRQNSLIFVRVGKELISFANEDITFVSELIAAEYPNYKRVIPQFSDVCVRLERDTLHAELSRLSAVADATSLKSVKFVIAPDNVDLRAVNPFDEYAEGRVTPIEHVGDWNEFTTQLNNAHLLDALRNTFDDAAEIEMRFVGDRFYPVLMCEPNNSRDLVLMMPQQGV